MEMSHMMTKLSLGALAVAAVAYFAPLSAAPPVAQPAGIEAADNSLVQQVHWRGYRRCRHWRRECAERHGWGTRRYHRCLWRHGCGRW
jgi:hypothetical protein